MPPMRSTLKLYFKCEKLADLDTFSKSDPYICLFEADDSNRIGRYLGCTDLVNNSTSPVFKKHIDADYLFESKQYFCAQLYDDDGFYKNLARTSVGDATLQKRNTDDDLGRVFFQLAHVVGSRGSTLRAAVTGKKGKGTVVISAQESASAIERDTVKLAFKGEKMKKMDTFGKSDPYFKLDYITPHGQPVRIHKSLPINNTLTPVWPPLPTLHVKNLVGGGNALPKNPAAAARLHSAVDPDDPLSQPCLVFRCFDKDLMSSDSMGEFVCSLRDLINHHRDKKPFVLRGESGVEVFGDIYVTTCEITHVPSFPELLSKGLQINMTCSIDFTGSNGDPKNARSLHYIHPSRQQLQQPQLPIAALGGTGPTQTQHMNEYEKAIASVAEVILEYDSDKLVPCFGFGAAVPTAQQGLPAQITKNDVSHFFNLTMQPDPHVAALAGILAAYHNAVNVVRLAGPTNFAPTIDAIRSTIETRKDPAEYTILVIITDGEITDMSRTIDAIVKCDAVPVSIIIVGVGTGSDFKLMDQLDGDGTRLRNSVGQMMRRDIVQFVPFHALKDKPLGTLAAEVLKEVPGQAVDWAQITRWQPPPPPPMPAAVPPPAMPGPPQPQPPGVLPPGTNAVAAAPPVACVPPPAPAPAPTHQDPTAVSSPPAGAESNGTAFKC